LVRSRCNGGVCCCPSHRGSLSGQSVVADSASRKHSLQWGGARSRRRDATARDKDALLYRLTFQFGCALSKLRKIEGCSEKYNQICERHQFFAACHSSEPISEEGKGRLTGCRRRAQPPAPTLCKAKPNKGRNMYNEETIDTIKGNWMHRMEIVCILMTGISCARSPSATVVSSAALESISVLFNSISSTYSAVVAKSTVFEALLLLMPI
jgi:hypothetical protein